MAFRKRDARLDRLRGQQTLIAGRLDKATTKLARDYDRLDKATAQKRRVDKAVTARLAELHPTQRQAAAVAPPLRVV